MIFMYSLQAILDGTKTQTRRIVRDGQDWASDPYDQPIKSVVLRDTLFDKLSVVYRVGQIRAVQPGRNKHSVARIKILRLRQEDARRISLNDAKAEGYNDPLE